MRTKKSTDMDKEKKLSTTQIHKYLKINMPSLVIGLAARAVDPDCNSYFYIIKGIDKVIKNSCIQETTQSLNILSEKTVKYR